MSISEIEAPSRLPFRDPQYRHDPYPYYAALRAEAPVWKTPEGLWAITRYEDVSKLLYDRSMSVGEIDFGPSEPMHNTVLGADAPKHTRLRRALSKWFTPKAVDRWTEIVEAEVQLCLDAVAANGDRFDAQHDLAYPVTLATISHILGVPVQKALELRKATYDIGLSLGAAPTDDELSATGDAFAWFLEHNQVLVEWKQENPGDGLIDAFLDLEKDGSMSRDETLASIQLLFSVGHLDIGFLIVNGIRILADNASLLDTWRTQPEARANIINEMLRMDTPEQFVTRQTTQTTTVGHTEIPAGEMLLLLIGAANKDPEMFPSPDVFDHTRDASLSKHLAFGAGLHGCAGQVLARAEATAVFTALADRYDTLTLAGDIEYDHSEFVRAIHVLPVQGS